MTVVHSTSPAPESITTKEFIVDGTTELRIVYTSLPVPAVPAEAREHGSGPFVNAGDSLGVGPLGAPDEQCYDGPDCATDEEMEDGAIQIADAKHEVEAMQTALDSELAAYQEFCSSNPPTCESGPSVMPNCWIKALDAAAAVAAAIALIVGAEGTVTTTVAAGWKLTRLGLAGLVLGAFAVGYTAGTYLRVAGACFMWGSAYNWV